MSAKRYIAILPGDVEDYQYWRAWLSQLEPACRDLAMLADFPDLILLGNVRGLQLCGGEAGLIIGDLIGREDHAPAKVLNPAQERAISADGVAHLIERYWGSYIALLRGAGVAAAVFRAPLGDLPAYVWRSHRGMLVASEVDLLTEFGGYAPAVDWIGIAEHLIAPDLRRPRTCLAGIEELGGGIEGRWCDGRWRIFERWSPWAAVPAQPRPFDSVEAGEYLGPIVRRSVAARTANAMRPLVLLSGGLDSSIVAACLAEADRPVRALTMVTRDPGGDERRYAEVTAASLGIPLTAVTREIASVDVAHSLAQGTPRPAEQSFAQATHAAVKALAHDADIDAVIHGGGGDNLFCSLQSAAPAADRLLSNGPDRRFWAVASEIAALAEVSVFRVAEKAVVRALRRRRGYLYPFDRSLLSSKAVAAGAGALQHSWLQDPHASLPGSASHVGLIAPAQSVVESPDPRPPIAWTGALVSQPIVEACLSIPSWSWYDRGCNRAPARHAFAEVLPDKIAWRRSKGAMNSFIVEIFEANRAMLSQLLLEGELAAQGMIDRASVQAILADPSPTRGESYGRVMRLADAEAWVRSWTR